MGYCLPMSGVDAELAAAYGAARLRWPTLDLPEAIFRGALLARLRSGEGPEAVRAMHAAELYLACACAEGSAEAARLLDEHYLSALRGSLLRVDAAPEFCAEALQLLRQKLLVRQEGTPPRIATYNGRSPLGAWLRAAAVRTALNLRRDRGRAAAPLRPLDEADGLAVSDPELAYIQAEHRLAVKEALAAAVSTLSQRQRTLLRLHLVEGLGIDPLSAIYGAHRATVARWIAAARAALLQELGRALSQQKGVGAAELGVFLGAIGSRLELSLSRLLRDESSAGAP